MTFISEPDLLETFRNWPYRSKHFPEELVKAGFHYTGTGDTVACSFCNGEIKNWKQRGDPVSEHRQLSPECEYIREYLRQGKSSKSAERSNHTDACNSELGVSANESILVNPTQIHLAPTVHKQSSSQTLRNMHGAHSHIASTIQKQLFCDYTKEEHRLKSFVGWTGEVDPRQLAHAGLYYLGNSDRVQCFSCRTIFRDWVVGDDPWIEHSKWYPDCLYIQLCLGKDAVNEIHKHVMQRRVNRTFDDVVDGLNCNLVC